MALKSGSALNVIKRFLFNNYYLLSSVMIFLSFPSYDIFFLKLFPFFAWIFLVPLIMYVQGRSLRDIFFVSFIAGLLGNLLAYGWIGNFGAVVPGGYVIILLFLIPSLSAFFSVKIVLSEFLSSRFESFRIIIYPAVWIIIDFVQSIGFLAFPWTYVGYSQYPFTPFIQVASVTGILGVNYFIILFNVSIAMLVQEIKKNNDSWSVFYRVPGFKNMVYVSAILIFVILWGSLRIVNAPDEMKKSGLKIAAVQTCISPWENWGGNKYRNLGELIKYTDRAMEENPDFIIWSESATLEAISFRQSTGKDSPFDRMLLDHVKKWGKPLFTGEIGVTGKKNGRFMEIFPQNNAVLIDGKGGVVDSYAKIFLVPFGEWFPYEKIFPAVKRLVASFGGSSFVPGEKPKLFEVNNLKFGPLICYEGIFYRLCREYKSMGADFLVNITNDGWTDTYNGHFQHFAASVFRAVENGLWVVRAGNTGVSAVVDPFGRVAGDFPILKKGFFTGSVYPEMNRETIYSRAGDVILYASALYILAFLIFFLIKGKEKED